MKNLLEEVQGLRSAVIPNNENKKIRSPGAPALRFRGMRLHQLPLERGECIAYQSDCLIDLSIV